MPGIALQRVLVGRRVQVEPAQEQHRDVITELDWRRSLHPAMAGWYARPQAFTPSTAVALERDRREPVAVFDAAVLAGYHDVVSLSVYTDPAAGRRGTALEAYALYVAELFDQGAHLVHHEVLELNRPIRRILRALGITATARLREHAYSAGQLWDVLVYSYDRTQWEHITTAVAPRAPKLVRADAPSP